MSTQDSSTQRATVDVVREEGRYAGYVDGVLAGVIEIREQGDLLVLPHTVVEDAFEGRGVGSSLVRGALDDVRRQVADGDISGMVPTCPFVRAFVEKHPEYADLVASPA